MSDPKSAGSDPSMDDILASIRKIISDDEARAQVAKAGPVSGGTPASAPLRAVPPARPAIVPPLSPKAEPAVEPRLAPASRDDILLLTDLIEDPKDGADAPAAIPLPRIDPGRIDPARATEMPQPSFDSPLPAAAPWAGKPTGASLVGGNAASSTASAFARLNQAVEENVLQPIAHDPGPSIGGSGKTVEDLVREMLRPMLQEWLDRNLPQMVERLVEKEIVRLTRR